MKKYIKYKKNLEYSYTMGPFPTIELIENRLDLVEEVLISEDFNDKDKLIDLLNKNKIHYTISDKQINKISLKDKEYVIGIFKKEKSDLKGHNHILLDGIDNMGNLGTIMRSMLAFSYRDLALISNTCDVYNPKVIRASMGAFFKLNIKQFNSLEDYKKNYPDNNIYSFVLDETSVELSEVKFKKPYSLAFGNEGKGLSSEYYLENKTFISQSKDVDSLNLPIACSIALYESRMK